ncbi:DNA cytosine methyltransferase [Vibrio parahaemolyticus]|uniref:DNA cytosine methyltransferase n=1 Tax=Vibrio parahaemolyticus TaxID=670 RepID=UPI000C86A285|nr:DNA cytosine methyltransferase [Vibrio parahaemolyticus]EHK2863129.1 DNA cytosine methyltransferase [Vibrio parahaemolyticus]EHU5131465.1 DNA cytosine methyltransferase [Vibrio parahaemolyticus]EJA3097467.1 DNA cytosine methyltransferase [Vibrio parahaemolyticus]EJB1784327.1 DNA cytosine methyltransferase [Vibrio parahaemolyticus]EJG1096874.1 DNA cytosine methyltransferase [Vibrio parahaemolyticus]
MTVKAIDLFAGAGGFTCAAHDAEVEVIAAIEFDQAASNTYRKNFIERENRNIDLRAGPIDGDINNVDPRELRTSLKLKCRELDLILGGPPCQGFSTHRIKNAGVNDPRNQLLLRYFEFVNEFKPKAFLVENVAGLLWKRHKDFFERFISLAESAGYVIKFKSILNAKDYGVPQNRKRVFILGVRKDVDKKCNISFPPEQTHFSPSSKRSPEWVAAASVFEKVPKELYDKYWEQFFKYENKSKWSYEETMQKLASLPHGKPFKNNDPCNINMQPSPMMVQRFRDTPLNGSREDSGEQHRLKCHSNGYRGHKDVYGRMFIHVPSNTITTGCNNPSKGRFVHPWLNHGITLRHAARLQTFPEWFDFYGSSTDIAKQIGNAVPPLLGKILISDICSRLK